jgi:hydroxymethylglutaryl-CoA synthase
MIKVGIDAMALHTSHYYLDMKTLAQARNVDVEKFHTGLGQRKMAVPAPGEDIVTFAANAAHTLLQNLDPKIINNINTVLFATESGIDQSKAAGLYLHSMFSLPEHCRVIELEQACYAATAGLQLGMALLRQNPQQYVLLLASDIARYGLNTTGESSQGGGAVAMLLSANPRLLEIEPESGIYAKDAMDFWRPNYREEALVDGRYSCDLYLSALEHTWREYSALSKRDYAAHQHFCYHVPVPRLVESAHKHLAKINGYKNFTSDQLQQQTAKQLTYCREMGNCYTASLYVSILSLLDLTQGNLAGQRIGLYSYGSGCVGEYFSAKIMPEYQKVLYTMQHQKLLAARQEISYAEYEKFYTFKLPEDGSHFDIPKYETGKFRLAAVDKHKRIYEKK